jgi:hypothetical protein
MDVDKSFEAGYSSALTFQDAPTMDIQMLAAAHQLGIVHVPGQTSTYTLQMSTQNAVRHVYLMVDCSGSMHFQDCDGFTRWRDAMSGAAQIVSQLSDQDYVEFWTFATDSRCRQPMIRLGDLTRKGKTQRSVLLALFEDLWYNMGPRGGTAIFDTVHEIVSNLQVPLGDRIQTEMVVLSDGEDMDSQYANAGSVCQELDRLRREGLIDLHLSILTVGINPRDRRSIKGMIGRDWRHGSIEDVSTGAEAFVNAVWSGVQSRTITITVHPNGKVTWTKG